MALTIDHLMTLKEVASSAQVHLPRQEPRHLFTKHQEMAQGKARNHWKKLPFSHHSPTNNFQSRRISERQLT